MSRRNSWACPNDPPCPHGSFLHDIEEMDDPLPSCCVEGCECGHDKELRRAMRQSIESQP